ncbi:MAG: hypothetical protein IIW56_10580 [Oscillospiraceae bacterium]|nr:hypothetical protein [Oscillospiraceae bacterium]
MSQRQLNFRRGSESNRCALCHGCAFVLEKARVL